MDSLLLGQIHFGDLDALNEVSGGKESVDLFLSSYAEPRGLVSEDYLKGKKWFVQGRRGTGKTAFLQYLSSQFLNTPFCATSFIAFKDIGGAERTALILRTQHVEIEQPEAAPDETDVAIAWRIYLHRELARLFEKNRDFLRDTGKVDSYIQKSKSFFDENSGATALRKFFDSLRQGTIEVPAFGGHKVSLKFRKRERVALSTLVEQLDNALIGLEINAGKRFTLLVDELNPSTVSQKEQDNDYILIRNLVSAVHIFNRLLRKHFEDKILIVCAVRSEVMQRVDPTGSEFSRDLTDKGFEITWRKRNPNDPYADAPLIKLVLNKIRASEKRLFGKSRPQSEIWTTYFDPKIFGLPPASYLYQSTWTRPRDIIRLFNACCEDGPKVERFRDQVFRRIQGQVQADNWKDRIHELQLVYNEIELGAIERCLTGFERDFTIKDFETHLNNLSSLDGEVSQLVKSRGVQPLLRELYKTGVVGNKNGNEQYWEHEFTPLPNFAIKFQVHRGLWSHLRLIS